MSNEKIINFMGQRHLAAFISVVLVLGSIGSLAFKGLNLGLDFTGGTLVELHFEEAPAPEKVRASLQSNGYQNAVVQQFGSENELLIRLQSDSAELDENGQAINVGEKIANALEAEFGTEVTLKQTAIIGAQIGEELTNDGGLGMLAALIAVFLYVAVRFQTKFSVGAIAALVHDVIIVLGVFSLLQLEFDLTVLAAVLAVVGYSLNDSIVVADRIRENFRILRTETSIEIVNASLSQTLGRTIMTSGTTILVLLALFFVGGELIHNFSTALLIGVGVGTYSSMYISATILLWLNITKEDLMPPEKEGAELDDLP